MYPIRLPTVLIRAIVCPIEMKTSCYPSLPYWIAQMPSPICRDYSTSCCSSPRRVVSGAWGCFSHCLRPQLWIVTLFSPSNPPVLTPFIQINWSGLGNREDWYRRWIYEIAWRIRNSKINPFWTCREKNLRMVLPPSLVQFPYMLSIQTNSETWTFPILLVNKCDHHQFWKIVSINKGMRKLAPVCPSSVTMTSLYKIGSPGCHGQENPAGSPPLKTLSLKKEQARFTSTNIQTGFWDDTDVAKLIVFSRKNKFVIVIFTLI